MKCLSILSAVAMLSLACGSPPAPTPPAAGPPSHGHCEHCEHHESRHGGKHLGREQHRANLSPALKEFHEVLGPVWHAPAGAERAAKACGASAALKDKASATSDAELIATTTALAKSCADADKAQVEPSLEKVHHRFHELAEKH